MSSICSPLRVMLPQWSHKNVRFLIFLHSKRKIDFTPRIISSSINDDSVPKQPQAISPFLSLYICFYAHIHTELWSYNWFFFFLPLSSSAVGLWSFGGALRTGGWSTTQVQSIHQFMNCYCINPDLKYLELVKASRNCKLTLCLIEHVYIFKITFSHIAYASSFWAYDL